MVLSASRTRSITISRLLVPVLIAVMLLGLMASGAAASGSGSTDGSYSYTQDGVSGYASWYSSSTSRRVTTDTYTDLYVFDGRVKDTSGQQSGTRVCLSVYTESYAGNRYISSSYESGCTTAPKGTFSASNDLSSASLQGTTVTLSSYQCTYEEGSEEGDCTVVSSRPMTVWANWTGIGELSSSSFRGKFSYGDCTFSYSSKGKGREATVSSSLGDGWGYLEDGRTTFKESCR